MARPKTRPNCVPLNLKVSKAAKAAGFRLAGKSGKSLSVLFETLVAQAAQAAGITVGGKAGA